MINNSRGDQKTIRGPHLTQSKKKIFQSWFWNSPPNSQHLSLQVNRLHLTYQHHHKDERSRTSYITVKLRSNLKVKPDHHQNHPKNEAIRQRKIVTKHYSSTSAYLQSYNSICSSDTCCILYNRHRLRRLWCNPFRGCIIKGCVNRESILPSKAGIRLHQHIHCQPSPTLSPATQWL